MSIVIVIDQL